MGKLEKKRALVTGSSSGIGAGVALAFAREGADVVVNYPTPKQQEAAEKIAEEVRSAGRKSEAIQADVSEPDQVAQLVEGGVAALGGIDILVNNAGIAATNKVEDMAIEEWDRMMAVHLRSVFLVTRLVLPMMYRENSGKIVNTASQLAYKASPGLSHYVAAKAAIVAFTRCLALEIGTRNVNTKLRGARRDAHGADCRYRRRPDGKNSRINSQGSHRRGRRHCTIVCVPRIRRGALLPGSMHQSEWWRHLSLTAILASGRVARTLILKTRLRCVPFCKGWTRQPVDMGTLREGHVAQGVRYDTGKD